MAEPFPLPHTIQAVRDALLYVQASWVETARSGRYGRVGTGAYASGILMRESLQHPWQGQPLVGRVVNLAPQAAVIEYGHSGYHLPTAIRWGQARTARRNKRGMPYLVVPFRHSVPRQGAGVTSQAARTMMPTHIYQAARRLRAGKHLTAGRSRGRAVHAAGLAPYHPATSTNTAAGRGRPRGSIYEGLRRQGARGHTQYLTFRTIRQDSPGWHIPARAGAYIVRAVEREALPYVRTLLQQAFAKDIAAALSGTG
jgi:hypothetical protein